LCLTLLSLITLLHHRLLLSLLLFGFPLAIPAVGLSLAFSAVLFCTPILLVNLRSLLVLLLFVALSLRFALLPSFQSLIILDPSGPDDRIFGIIDGSSEVVTECFIRCTDLLICVSTIV
jgi:hypothetical protein